MYLSSILLIKRFHSPINFLTGNVSLTLFSCSVLLIIKYILVAFYPNVYNANPNTCILQQYSQNVVLCQVVYALCLVSFHRLCIMLHSQIHFFKTNKWAFVCITIQWIFSFVLSIPTVLISEVVSLFRGKKHYYSLFVL